MQCRLILWSVTLPWGNSNVLILQIYHLIQFYFSVFCFSSSILFLSNSNILDVEFLVPFLIPVWDFSSCWLTTILFRIWVIWQRSVVLTFCLQGRYWTSISQVLVYNLYSTSSASGNTATVAADVWTLPCVSVLELFELYELYFHILTKNNISSFNWSNHLFNPPVHF